MARRIAVCFFGITRSLSHTLPALEAHVIGPARAAGETRLFAHLFRQQRIDNPRSGEQGVLDPDEYRLLQVEPDALLLEEPGGCLEPRGFDALKQFGDSWSDEYRSLRNLVHQLHSLDRVTDAALAWGADVVLFARPDLRYHDSLAGPIRLAVKAGPPLVQLPRWQPHGGMNDRFAVCRGPEAIAAYGKRIHAAADFCRESGEPLNGEKLVQFVLARAGIEVRSFAMRASRVRADGSQRYEEFARPEVAALKATWRPRLTALADRLGLRDAGRAVQRKVRP